jgi:YD repeat-containing protein
VFTRYDPGRAEIKARSEPTFGTAASRWTTFSCYDFRDIKTSTDPRQITTSYQYDEIGQQTRRTLKAAADDATARRPASTGRAPT